MKVELFIMSNSPMSVQIEVKSIRVRLLSINKLIMDKTILIINRMVISLNIGYNSRMIETLLIDLILFILKTWMILMKILRRLLERWNRVNNSWIHWLMFQSTISLLQWWMVDINLI